MRSSLISRAVVAAASVAIGSVALAAVPATAATSSGITRDQVLSAAAGLRAGVAATPAQSTALTDVINRACTVVAGQEEPVMRASQALTAGDDADGFAVTAIVYPSGRNCSFTALATADASFQLSGKATITSTPGLTPNPVTSTLFSGALSGDVFVTPIYAASSFSTITATASGNAAKTTTSTTTTKVKDKKTSKEKKAAKKKYDKRIKAAKKSYKKALKKADGSKSKKAAAKKSYKAKRSTAKAAYKKAVAGSRIVTRTTSTTENRPFSVTGTYGYVA